MEKNLKKACQSGLVVVLLLVAAGCQKNIDKLSGPAEVKAGKSIPLQNLRDFQQINPAGDNNEFSPAHIDANLVNGWGITFPTSGPAWISTEGTGMRLVLNGAGSQPRGTVARPGDG